MKKILMRAMAGGLMWAVLAAPAGVALPAAAPTDRGVIAIDVADVFIPVRDCVDHPYAVAVTPADPNREWLAQIEATKPNGTFVDKFETAGTGNTVLQRSILVCPKTGTGTYQVKVTVNYPGTAQDLLDFDLDLDLFEVMKDTPHVTLTLSDNRPQRYQPVTVTIRARSQVTGKPVVRGKVVLQQRVAPYEWENVGFISGELNKRGVYKYTGRANSTGTFRAFLKRGPGYAVSVSPNVKMTVTR